MTWPHGDPNAVVARILRDSAYRTLPATSAAKPQESPLIVVLRWIWEHAIRPLLHPLAHAAVATRGIGAVAGYVLVVLALLGLAFLVFRLTVAVARRPVRESGPAGTAFALDVERGAREWRTLARAAAARGDYAHAIAALFNAALAELDERAVVAFDPARTPGEYRRLVRRARAAAAPPFDILTERFDRALYAEEPPHAAEFEAAERALAAFEPALTT